MRITYLHQYFNTPEMIGGTRSYEMARHLVAMGHEVNVVTSWREPDSRKDWFTTEEDGIQVHWLSVQYSNHRGYNQRIKAFLKFAWCSALLSLIFLWFFSKFCTPHLDFPIVFCTLSSSFNASGPVRWGISNFPSKYLL